MHFIVFPIPPLALYLSEVLGTSVKTENIFMLANRKVVFFWNLYE